MYNFNWDQERKDFEEWFENSSYPLEHSNWFRRDSEGDYELNFVDQAWEGWCARARRGDKNV